MGENNNQMLTSFIAGLGSGALSSIICAPLDLIRTRFQVMGSIPSTKNILNLSIYCTLRNIIKMEGMNGCFRGLGATLVVIPTFWGIYFPVYERTKSDLHQLYMTKYLSDTCIYELNYRNQENGISFIPPQVHMISAIFAGAVADLCCNPLFVVRTRMQTEALHYLEQTSSKQKTPGMLMIIKNLYREGGIEIFWSGFSASLCGLSHVAIQFPIYEWMKARAKQKSSTNKEDTIDLFVASSVSKICASIITYPHEVLRSRMMDYRSYNNKNIREVNTGLISTLRRIIINEGWYALYSGLQVSLIRVIPNCSITFISYELILRSYRQNTITFNN